MSLGTNTPWHWNVARIHSTTHPSLGSEIISCHALRLHPLHANHRHRPRSRSTWHMGPCHAPRNGIPWWYLVKSTEIWQHCKKMHITMEKQKILLITRVIVGQGHGMQIFKCIRSHRHGFGLTRGKRCRQFRGWQHWNLCITLKITQAKLRHQTI